MRGALQLDHQKRKDKRPDRRECPRYRSLHEQARQHHHRFGRTAPEQVGCQMLGELRQCERKHEVEEQLQRRDHVFLFGRMIEQSAYNVFSLDYNI